MRIREQFEITRNYTYLNTAATSPLPNYVVDEVCKFMRSHSGFAEAAWDIWMEKANVARERCATMINAHPHDIAFMKNTGEGLNTVCAMLPGKGNVITTNMEFPSNFLPWRAKYNDLRIVDGSAGVDLHDFERMIDDSTEAVTFSEITYNSGERLPTREISDLAHEHGAIVVSDAVQALGAVDVDVKALGIDVLCCGSHKWLTSPFGVGIFYVSHDLIDDYSPPYIGWSSLDNDEDFSLDNTALSRSAKKFEIGNLNFPGILGLSRSIEVMLDRGVDVIEDEVTILSEYIMDSLAGMGIEVVTPYEDHGGIVSCKMPDAKKMVDKLLKDRIVVSYRDGLMRISAHFWNNKEDIDRLVGSLR